MRLIRKITDNDILGSALEYIDTISRYGSRGVVVDNLMNVALMYMSSTNLYKLPGGGVDEGEDSKDAFLREIQEETGYDAEIIHELGYIEEHKNRNNYMQFSYCYLAKANDSICDPMLTDNEIQLGMVVRWMTLDQALSVMQESVLNCADYSAKFMLLRDQTILEEAICRLTEEAV
ncbi:NUDIX hydrolase [Paenibacillus sp. Soil766]|uniref:NUDIX hydrolase n=1 Tax=Paenibacillus sp. Soil766 TaxID=1736404 RepID=UPI000708F48E|nr:NUDIX domain-containing protein [Paenibacillus sp. Soil766]KRF09644.1 NUDIX hydrolase [Paenibacillus sp. Soil766]